MCLSNIRRYTFNCKYQKEEGNMKKQIWIGVFLLVVIFSVAACSSSNEETAKPVGETQKAAETESEEAPAELVLNPPSLDLLADKDDPLSESIKRGYTYIHETNTALDPYVGNELSCSSCHANAGTTEAASFVGVTARFPEYNPRSAKVMTIEDRINGCMVRSMNGEKLPLDSQELRDMVSYLTYISTGIPVMADIPWRNQNNIKLEDIPETDVANGERLYAQSCAACHGGNGEGTGANTGPAVWGANSFNDGAGLARISKLTPYIQNNMPKGQGGTLTLQEAADIAAYILKQERPKFPGRANDWPLGGAAKDSPYYNEIKSVIEGIGEEK